MPDDLTLAIGNRVLAGWTEIRVTRGIERCTPDFEIGMTELFSSEAQALVVQPGDACQVMLGNNRIITGYVDVFAPSIDAKGHNIRVSGRGRCQDLLDCSAEWPGSQIAGNTVAGIARKLASVYGDANSRINVIEANGIDVGKPIPLFSLHHGESPWDIIEQICRYRALLAYENADGNLVLAKAPDVKTGTRAASGFTEGKNVQAASARFSANLKFSDYIGYRLDIDPLLELGSAGNIFTTVTDETVLRHRTKAIISETTGSGEGLEVAKRRVTWEMNTRYGRSNELHITTDGWRDSADTLWEPNTLVELTLPSLKIDQQLWLISEVTYKRDSANGTTAELTIKPPQAFSPEPIAFYPIPPDVDQALGKTPPK